MALLQAARYYALSGDINKAYSFGLNRAIFYAWAKRRGKGVVKPARRKVITKPVEEVKEKDRVMVYVGDEGAFLGKNGWFTIGNQEQKPDDFKREIASKIESVMPFEEAWEKALKYIQSFDKKTLLSQREFFEKVYKPVRDTFPEIPEIKKKKRKTLLDFT